MKSKAIEYIQGDLTDADLVTSLCKDMDCVFHIAALVGPYHPTEMYKKVNYDGSVNILNGCRAQGVNKISKTAALRA